ncbi:hypothetical protein [Aureispira anguillae]|uniref:Uncharacterized protein n=1 Tax=Aureispira anguillae TaxID=2864201 RepID=A0A915YK79_9BACT|nr:hypothetical protein [Aureispira anguillae]BDS14618.1 hypothetical protein AsAng_0053990 [Aureispira anguillae]
MSTILKSIFIFVLVHLTFFVYGQAQIKEQTIVAYGIGQQDSIIRFRKTVNYDSLGRLINRQNYYYHHREKGVLVKEEKAFFNPQDQWLTEQIITYPLGKDPIYKKLRTKYLDYQANEKNSKHILRQLYDKYGELSKEDTLTYDKDSNLIAVCNYNYQGSTSLFCNYYTYKDNLQTRWTTYTKWTTINVKGMVVERQAKRRDFRYKYNKNKQLTRSFGRHYKKRFCQKIKYDKQHKILEDKSIVKHKARQVGTKDNPPQKKFYIHKEEKTLHYQNGLLVKEIQLVNKKETKKKEITYQDSLPKTITTSLNTIVVVEKIYTYNAQLILTQLTTNKYHKNGKIRYSIITHFNPKGNVIKEEQIIGQKTLSVLEIKYDKHGNPLVQSLSAKNNKNLEKTLYIYKYY